MGELLYWDSARYEALKPGFSIGSIRCRAHTWGYFDTFCMIAGRDYRLNIPIVPACITMKYPIISISHEISYYILTISSIKLRITSSTAQGGGGSLKNRKPIGEVGCCESGMAARSRWWTERWLRSPLFLFLSLTIYLPTCLPIYLSMYLFIYRSISFI